MHTLNNFQTNLCHITVNIWKYFDNEIFAIYSIVWLYICLCNQLWHICWVGISKFAGEGHYYSSDENSLCFSEQEVAETNGGSGTVHPHCLTRWLLLGKQRKWRRGSWWWQLSQGQGCGRGGVDLAEGQPQRSEVTCGWRREGGGASQCWRCRRWQGFWNRKGWLVFARN